MAEYWKPETFLRAVSTATVPEAGYTYRGLGMYKITDGSPKGKRPPMWGLIHLGSGHSLYQITAHIVDAFTYATLIAECADWDFHGLEGWKNTEPDLKEKVMECVKGIPPKVLGRLGEGYNRDVANTIAQGRM